MGDVVNEAIADDSDNSSTLFKAADPWYPAVEDYVYKAFAEAHAAAPSSIKLFYNDYGAEGTGAKASRVIQLVKNLQQKNIRIDGIGLQMHVSTGYYPSFDSVSANIKALGDLGLEVHITEMDVKCPTCNTTQGLEQQAAIYGGMLKARLDNDNCRSFETWG